jgi:hypothetical protein
LIFDRDILHQEKPPGIDDLGDVPLLHCIQRQAARIQNPVENLGLESGDQEARLSAVAKDPISAENFAACSYVASTSPETLSAEAVRQPPDKNFRQRLPGACLEAFIYPAYSDPETVSP